MDDHSDIESYGNFFESGMCDGYRYGTLDSMDLFAERCKVEFGTIADVEDFQLMLSAGTTDGAGLWGVVEWWNFFLCPIFTGRCGIWRQ